MGQELRSHERIEWNRLGKITSLAGHSICDCWVKDISGNGAHLLVLMMQLVPDYFRLNYGVQKIEPKCRVRSREGNELDVEFFRDS